jgi:glycosyltransferase involved in cell wall biosynthesis
VGRAQRARLTVHDAAPGIKLLLVGEGTARRSFEKQAEALGLSGSMQFLGALQGEPLRAAYRQASLLVLPSLNENFALVTLEAMASGLPVIGTKVGAIPTIIDDGVNGYLVPPADSAALSEKITALLTSPDQAKQFGKAARAKAEAQFDWEYKASQTNALLRRLLTRAAKERP